MRSLKTLHRRAFRTKDKDVLEAAEHNFNRTMEMVSEGKAFGPLSEQI